MCVEILAGSADCTFCHALFRILTRVLPLHGWSNWVITGDGYSESYVLWGLGVLLSAGTVSIQQDTKDFLCASQVDPDPCVQLEEA